MFAFSLCKLLELYGAELSGALMLFINPAQYMTSALERTLTPRQILISALFFNFSHILLVDFVLFFIFCFVSMISRQVQGSLACAEEFFWSRYLTKLSLCATSMPILVCVWVLKFTASTKI